MVCCNMKPLRIEGSPDATQIAEIANYIREKYALPAPLVLADNYIVIEPSTYTFDVAYTVSKEQAEGKIIHHPDIMILDKQMKLKAIIEIDGSIHDTPSGRRKTERRNQDYNRLNVDYLAINLADIKYVGVSIEDVIDQFLGRR